MGEFSHISAEFDSVSMFILYVFLFSIELKIDTGFISLIVYIFKLYFACLRNYLIVRPD